MDEQNSIYSGIQGEPSGSFRKSIKLRWIVIFLMVPIVGVLYAVDREISIVNIFILISAACVLNFFYGAVERMKKPDPGIIMSGAGFLDVVLISFIVYFTGGILSPLYPLYFLLLIGGSFNNEIKEKYAVYSGFIIFSYVFVYFAGNGWSFMGVQMGEFAVKTMFMGVFAFIIKKSANEIKKSIMESRIQAVEKAHLHKELMESNANLEKKIKSATSNLEKTNLLLIKKNISLLAAHEIYKTADETKTKGELFTRVLDIIIPLMKASGGFFMDVNETGAKVVVETVKIFSGAEKIQEGVSFIIEKESLLKDIIVNKKAVWVEETAGSGEMIFEKTIVNGSVIAVPVVSAGRTNSILVIYNKNPYVYSKTDCELLELLGEQVGALLHNRILYDEMSAKAIGLERLMKVMTNTTTSLAREVIISNLLTESLKRLFPGASGVVMITDEKGQLVIRGAQGYKNESLEGRKIPKDSIAGFVFMKNRNMMMSIN